jgi:uncharacterized protein
MKTKRTFLLALTFLFLFSGSVYGDDFQNFYDKFFKKDGSSREEMGLPENDKDGSSREEMGLPENGKEFKEFYDKFFSTDPNKSKAASRNMALQIGMDAANRGDFKKAYSMLLPLAEQGLVQAQYNLGNMYSNGQGVPQDFKEAVRWFRLAAEQGFPQAQSNLGMMYDSGQGVPQDDKEAVKWWRLAAEQGIAQAQSNLGSMYAHGAGVPQDFKEAIKWHRLAAEQGEAIAQNELGFAYRNGRGVPQDYKEAVKWYRHSAEQGIALAQFNLGQMYDSGQGVSQDYKEAVKWYRLSAEQGDADAQCSLGFMYAEGQGVPKDDKKAVKWFRLSAEQGDADAQGSLGLMYAEGKGVLKDYVLAHMWTNLAVSNGIEVAIKGRDILEKQMTPSQISEAQRLARNWKPKSSTERIRVAESTNPITPKQQVKAKKEPSPQSGSGSGFFVSKMGHAITNAHVVQNCKKITIGDNANKQVPAELINTDRSNDLALLKLSTLEMASAESKSLIQKLNIVVVPLASKGLLRSNDVRLGEKVLVAGYPFGEYFSNTIKVTGGLVSATRGVGDDSGQFQLDAAVQPGNSGGPIYDSSGNIVGVVVSQLDKRMVEKAIGSLPENVNFGIKASTVRQFLISSGVPSKKSERIEEKSTEQLAEIAKNQALMVMCLQ